MKLKHFIYELPEGLIAQEPLPDRAQARLMVIDRMRKQIRHDRFENIGRYLPDRSLLVVNNSKVIPARLKGVKERSGGNVEIFLLRKIPGGPVYEVLMRPTRRIKAGDVIRFPGSPVRAVVLDVPKRLVRFSGPDISREVFNIGHMPLPPYIKRQDKASDRDYYQTVYARHAGSVAAPTAGLHFTTALLRRLKEAGHDCVPVTLHINYATFKPVEEDEVSEHRMHEESYSVSPAGYEKIRRAREAGRGICAVGTTSCRVLETVFAGGALKGSTDLFIYPGCHFQAVDHLVTNFHLPQSSLLMLVYAFGGMALMKRAYREAIRQKYRFFSYGDAMLIL
ncbi:MAG TPA: tRNA preQ1(34) S-adenosylmethionine ribosyltransferase-isomerase QueA [Candidatus Omnitrophota bacterium]|nr:tRNA preQ1(34) S-adenosylmethionine ribosyltransferase-isomerase QueA [Candidatus Omnitrophota bacterium]HPB67893.1 tRNA preQ1(34) S-adenosylmethionine ribosyltransferase-isomerase QueA [Candidatus Omnitrophota bacterium]HQO57314.1 tRNA preQ1(34) S-adenosylmethionine ribosyltransferase-isomerase QueA [Candidatus Omnitrophota bacterium]